MKHSPGLRQSQIVLALSVVFAGASIYLVHRQQNEERERMSVNTFNN